MVCKEGVYFSIYSSSNYSFGVNLAEKSQKFKLQNINKMAKEKVNIFMKFLLCKPNGIRSSVGLSIVGFGD